jgi:hypothetical protein
MRILIGSLGTLLLLAGCGGKGGSNPSTSAGATRTATVVKAASLSWTASTGTPSGYSVEQSSDGVTFTQVATSATTSAVVSGLPSGHTYYFRVKGYNAGGYSAASSVITLSF